MKIFEGVKASRKLIQTALENPDFTFGFEAEFFVKGAQKYLQDEHTMGLETMDLGGGEHYVKPLGEATWHDVLHFFIPLNVDAHSIRDNHAILYDRLSDFYESDSGGDANSKTAPEMWQELLQNHRVHEMLAWLQMYPQGRMMGLSEQQGNTIRGIAASGDINKMQSLGRLNQIKLATAEVGHEAEDYNVTTGHATRSSAYDLLAELMSDKLGVPIFGVVSDDVSFQKSRDYKQWILTHDSSLDVHEANTGDVGCELISPIMSAKEGVEMLLKVLDMIQGDLFGLELYTTIDTALHINLGVRGKEIDALKILVLLGDEHILQQFEREMGEYSKSIKAAMQKRLGDIGDEISASVMTGTLSPELVMHANQALRSMQQHGVSGNDIKRMLVMLNQLKPEGKSYSVDFSKLPSGYVEFRAIGNKGYENRKQEIINTVYHMLVITYAATEPEVYRQEFLKKLYKMVVDAVADIEPSMLAASVGMIGRDGWRGDYPAPIEKEEPTPYDGENFIQYGFDSGSDTQ